MKKFLPTIFHSFPVQALERNQKLTMTTIRNEKKRNERNELPKKIIMKTAYFITEMHSDYRIIHLCHNVWTVFVLFSSSPIMCVPASFCLISDYFVGK